MPHLRRATADSADAAARAAVQKPGKCSTADCANDARHEQDVGRVLNLAQLSLLRDSIAAEPGETASVFTIASDAAPACSAPHRFNR